MQRANHKVSIIVPVYNVAPYIELSLKSICEQTFDSYEIILVNDGTKDDSIERAQAILQASNVDYVIHHKENGGLPSARNAGLKLADGKYVIFIDSDDIITDDFISTLYEACEANDSNAAFAEYQVTRMKNRYGVDDSNHESVILSRNELLQKNMLRSVKIHLCAVMLNREFLLKNDLWFNETLRFGEEVDYTWRLYPLLDKIVHIKSKMYKYLIRENSLMTNQNSERVIYLLENMHKVIENWFANCPEDRERYYWAEQKIYFEKMHAFAAQSSYKLFKDLLQRTNYKERMVVLKDFPDAKIRILSSVLKHCPSLFWLAFKIL